MGLSEMPVYPGLGPRVDGRWNLAGTRRSSNVRGDEVAVAEEHGAGRPMGLRGPVRGLGRGPSGRTDAFVRIMPPYLPLHRATRDRERGHRDRPRRPASGPADFPDRRLGSGRSPGRGLSRRTFSSTAIRSCCRSLRSSTCCGCRFRACSSSGPTPTRGGPPGES